MNTLSGLEVYIFFPVSLNYSFKFDHEVDSAVCLVENLFKYILICITLGHLINLVSSYM